MKNQITESDVPRLQALCVGKSAIEVLEWASEFFGDQLTFASSLGQEDQVLAGLIAGLSNPCSIFTLDTGRLFPESYTLLAETEKRLDLEIALYFPKQEAVEEMVSESGINLFYKSIEARKQCCRVRKLEPLGRALFGKSAWICGLRRDQAVTRGAMQVIEWDSMHQMIKINPLIDWSLEEVTGFLTKNNLPYNPLHDQGFVSIGCASCTRAIKPGQHLRDGRWWWESAEQKECGLHSRPENLEKKENLKNKRKEK